MTSHDVPARQRPTLEGVAALAGVSRATVSRVVNGSPSVDPVTRAVVERAIDELNYVPNQAARALMTGRTNVIALVAAEPDIRVFGDPYFADIVRGVSWELGTAGLRLMLAMIQRAEDHDQVEQYLLGNHVDGVLLISAHADHTLADRLLDAGVPLVEGGRPARVTGASRFVDNDNLGGAILAGAHLLSVGRTRIGTIAGPLDMSAGVDRLNGFRQALGDRFDPDLVEHADFTTRGGADAAERLLQRRPDVDGLFVASDLMAIGAMGVLRRAGRRIPEDVAVVGFDDSALAAAADPPLTTIRQQTILQGRMMVRLLLKRMNRHPAAADDLPVAGDENLVLPVELVIRDST